MGGNGTFLASGGFSRQEYKAARDPIAGIKVIKHILDSHTGMPKYCNTPNTMYLREDSEGNVTQLRVYRGREPYLDVDWGHNHGRFSKGTPHVQEWHKKSDGNLRRDKEPRDLSPSEKKKFGEVFKKLGVKVEIPK